MRGAYTAASLACLIGAVVVGAGCQVDGDEMDSGFYDPSASVSTTAPPIPAEDTESDGASSGADETEGDASDTENDSGDPGTSGESSATTDGGDTSGASTGGASEQPEDGMYSECTAVTDCVGLTQCITNPAGDDGFCTRSGCMDALLDCDPVPGGTAFTACVSMGGTSSAVCALDCSGDRTCPTGMECTTLPEGTLCV